MSNSDKNDNNNNPFSDFQKKINKSPQNNFIRNMIIMMVIAASIYIFYIFMQTANQQEYQINFTEYKGLLEQDLISKGRIVKNHSYDFEFHGTLKQPVTINIDGRPTEVTHFVTRLGVLDTDAEQVWLSKGIELKYEEGGGEFWGYIISFLPWIILIGLYIFFLRRMQSGGSKGIFSFGKSKAKLLSPDTPKVTFKDVSGADEAKYELEEVIEFLKDPTKFQRLGGKIPKGVLMLGPPGTGKTLLARAVAGEAGVPFYTISGADFVEMFVGVGASRVRDLFEQAKKNAPCIVFIDEIDAVGRHRGAGLGGGHDEREQTLNQLLVEMDGFEQNSGVIIIAATNRPDVLDPALLRPGRFDRQIVVDRPDVRGREGIFKVHVREIPIGDDVDLEILAKGTPGLSGADIANIVNEAALLAARRGSDKVTMYDFENAKDKVLMGIERKSMVISDKEKKMTAYHEMGHALVGKFLPSADPVHKVTIIPRGRALGITSFLPNEDFYSKSRDYIQTSITRLLAGRAAEKLVFNVVSTGAANDLQRATDLARKMVCEWGMSEVLGPVNFSDNNNEVFLGRDFAQHSNHSEKTAQIIDSEIRKIILDSDNQAMNILEENEKLLHKSSLILLERETIDGSELEKIINGEDLPPVNQNKINALRSMKIDEGTDNNLNKDDDNDSD